MRLSPQSSGEETSPLQENEMAYGNTSLQNKFATKIISLKQKSFVNIFIYIFYIYL